MNDDALWCERLHDGALSALEHGLLSRRLRDDATLVHRLAQERILMRRLSVLLVVENGSPVADRILHLLTAERPSRVMRLAEAVQRRAQQGTRSRWWSRLLAPLLAAMLVLGVGWWMWHAGPSGSSDAATGEIAQGIARLVDVSAGVQVIRDGKALGAQAGMPLLAEDRIEAGGASAGTTEVLYPDRSSLRILPATTLRLWTEDDAKRVSLDHGEVRGDIAHQPPGKAMRLLSAQAEAEVVGTRFTLRVEPMRTRLEVQQGEVSLRRTDGHAVAVHAGYAAVAAMDVPLESQPIAQPMGRAGSSPAFQWEFDDIPTDQWTPNELVRLREAGGEITAIASKPYVDQTPTWRPDVAIELFSHAYNSGEPKGLSLFKIPIEMEIRIRIRSENPGEWYMALVPADRRFGAEHFYSKRLSIANDGWHEFTMSGSDLTPYDGEGSTRAFTAGVEIQKVAVFGYGTGKLLIDRFAIVPSSGNPHRP